MFSFVTGAMGSMIIAVILMYNYIKKSKSKDDFDTYQFKCDYIWINGYVLLCFSASIGALIGVCYDFGFKPLIYSSGVGVISCVVSYVICVMLGLHERMSGGIFQIFSDAAYITFIIVVGAMISGFIYGINSVM